MLSALLGKKIGMTQVHDEAGVLHPVTVVQAGPCSVLQVKNVETDGYHAVQIGFEDVKPHRAAKPQIGHAATMNATPAKTTVVRNFRATGPPNSINTAIRNTNSINAVVILMQVASVRRATMTPIRR